MTLSRRILFTIFAPVAVLFLKLTWASFRYRVHGFENIRKTVEEGEPVIFAFWHESLLTACWYMAELMKTKANIGFLISPSVDGEFTVMMLAYFNGSAIRGSGTRSGATAIRGLYRAIRRDKISPGITLDGPKGPRRRCKPGAVMIARMTGTPIVPVATAASRSFRPKSWDRHLVPYPLAVVPIVLGEPYTVANEGGDEVLEEQRVDLEERLHHLTERAEALVGAPNEN